MKCVVCGKGRMVLDPTFGWLPCTSCRQRQADMFRPRKQTEFTTESIREGRKEHANDILQPFRKGQLSKEYVKKYGTKGIRVTKDEVKNARNVWDDDRYYKSE